ncbi:PAS domain-containing sensor histidine kinase [Hymenobacter metallicola]|uniref:histidine kinase n=1 Tax=Hymenobacter metallicola TaxID=2563114 RepID=A0A4Z0Q1W8_9BACT|nr:PAS domain S-box protein [Hymenobacter metallicola]TGE22732.1 PAS domain S-box protein [Hymenobacter metallicola]
MLVSPGSPLAAVVATDTMVEMLFEVSLSGLILYTPVYDAAGHLDDLAVAYLNPVAQRLLRLPAHPATTYRQQFADTLPAGGWTLHRDAFVSGQLAEADLSTKVHGRPRRFRVQGRRAGEMLLVSVAEPANELPRPAEEALRRAHEHTVDILESTTDAFYALDAAFCFTYVNQRAARLWGRDRDALLGRHYWTEFPQAVGSESYHQHYAVLQTGQPAHDEAVSPLLGSWVETLIYPTREGGLSVFFRDITDRKQAETALRRSEAQLAAVFEALPVGVGVMDIQGRVTLANRQMQHYLPNGLAPWRDDTPVSRWRAYHPDGRPLPRSEFPGARALRGEKVVPGTDMLYTPSDGTAVWTQVSAVPLPDHQGNVTGHAMVIVDIDAGKRAKEALQASEQRLRALIENLPGGAVFVVDQELRYQLAEGQALHQAGLAPADLLGRTVREVMPPDLWQQHEPNYRTALAGHPFAVELEAHGRTFLTRGVPLLGAAGQVEAALAVSYDITDHKQIETALRCSEERLQQALSIDTVGVLFFDLQGRIHDANAAFQRMSGFTHEDFVSGRVQWDEITPPEFLDATRRSQQELLTLGQNTPYEKQYIRPDGSRWWGLFAGKRLRTGECVEFVLDITASKEAQRQLHESQQQLQVVNEQLTRTNIDLDNFIYTASHDLKAPIHNIEGLLQALQEQLPGPVQHTYAVGPLLGMMEEAVQRFQRTIAHLSDVVKLQEAHEEDGMAVALRPVIEDVCRDLEPHLAAAGAQIEIDVQECPAVPFSATNLRSVVYNLLSNAVKYRHPDRVPRVRIACRQQEAYTVLSVQDNGLGLEPNKQAEMFQMFRRFHAHVEGSGIGLYMVKRMVENAGGRVDVRSVPGEGTTLAVYIRQEKTP